MTFIILMNVCLMAIDYHKIEEDADFYSFFTTANTVFLDIYYVEFLFKILGLGIKQLPGPHS